MTPAPLTRGHLTLVDSSPTVPADRHRDVPPLVAVAAGLVVLLTGSALTLVLVVAARPADLLIAVGGVVVSTIAALGTITRIAFGARR